MVCLQVMNPLSTATGDLANQADPPPGYCDALLLGGGELQDARCVHITLHLKDSQGKGQRNTGRSVPSQSCPGLGFYPFHSSPLYAILSGGPDMKLIQPRHALQRRNERHSTNRWQMERNVVSRLFMRQCEPCANPLVQCFRFHRLSHAMDQVAAVCHAAINRRKRNHLKHLAVGPWPTPGFWIFV